MKKTDSDAILDYAVGLFRQKGYRSTSMADIGKAAGLLKGSVYHHFPSKEAILIGAVERLSIHFQETVFTLAYDRSRSERERLCAMIDLIEAYFREHKTCVMAHLAVEGMEDVPEAGDRVARFFVTWREAFAIVLAPRYGDAVAQSLAEDAIAQLEGAVIMLNIFNDMGSLDRACSYIRALL